MSISSTTLIKDAFDAEGEKLKDKYISDKPQHQSSEQTGDRDKEIKNAPDEDLGAQGFATEHDLTVAAEGFQPASNNCIYQRTCH